jgi:hypothetical protein
MARALRFPLTGARAATFAGLMTVNDLELIVYFLRRTVARGIDEELLLNLVEKIEKEIERCRTRSK